MVSAIDQLYQQVIMDHAAEKHGSAQVEPSDTSSYQVNPTCGDEVTLEVTLKGDTLAGLAWQGQGCSISQASLSMMNDLVAGKSLAEIEQLWNDFDQMMHSRGLEVPDEILDPLEDAASLQGTSKFPNRVKCALLGWMALRESIAKRKRGKKMSEERPWENRTEVPQRFQEVAAGNEDAGPYQPSKAHQHAEAAPPKAPVAEALSAEDKQESGEEPPEAQTFSDPSAPLTPAEAKATEEDVIEALKDVIDPELGINIVDLGLVYGAEIHPDGAVTIEMTLTSAACPLTDMLEEQTRWVLSAMATSVAINWVWMPPWGPDRITEEGREQLRALGFNV